MVAANKSTSVRDKLLEEAEKWQFAVNWLKEKMDEESGNSIESSTSSSTNHKSGIGSTTSDLMWNSNSTSNEDSLTRTFHRTTSAVVTLEEANAILAEFSEPSSSSNETTEPLILMETDEREVTLQPPPTDEFQAD